ncbi:uncharacterized protein METZ01_LOCUS64340 [marine metagenome]|uniref:DUF4384 domain-containing protein n=1 Tax=marine metagenome TaxID=408172 RepID=A0A381T5L2_9ZZZZ
MVKGMADISAKWCGNDCHQLYRTSGRLINNLMHSKTSFFLIITLLFFMLISSACKTGLIHLKKEEQSKPKALVKPPDWVLGNGHPGFPQERYLVGVGFSYINSVLANESARSSLAKNLKVKIRSTIVDISTKEKTHIKSVIETEVDTVLEGVEIKSGWLDQNKGVYYALAVMDRSLAASSIQDKISKIESALQRNLNEGIKAENSTDVITALSNYLSGYHKALSLSQLKSALHIVTPSEKSPGPKNISSEEFESRIKGIVQNLNLATVSGDRQLVKTQKEIALTLVAKVFLLIGENKAPVSNIPVIFNYETGLGEMEDEKISEQDGTVQTTIHKILSYKEANHVVAVKMDYSKIITNFDGDFVEEFLSPLKNKGASFNYVVQAPKWTANKSQGWQDSILDLGYQIITNIPPGTKPSLGVIPFKDLRHDRVTFCDFSRILNEDIKHILARAEDLKLIEIKITEDQRSEEIAKANELDYYLTGSYRMESTGLEVRSRLIHTQTKTIQSSANILIERKELNLADFALCNLMVDELKSAQKGKSYHDHLEKLVAAKPLSSSFKVTVWSEKRNYEINENVVFKITSDKNGYLTMLYVNPNGDFTVLFPNKFHRNNFIKAGVVKQVPDPDYNLLKSEKGFTFKLRGPAGLDRIKAIVTLNSASLLKLDHDGDPKSVRAGTTFGTKTIQTLLKQLDSMDGSSWAEAQSEIFIFKEGEKYTRGSRKISIYEEL